VLDATQPTSDATEEGAKNVGAAASTSSLEAALGTPGTLGASGMPGTSGGDGTLGADGSKVDAQKDGEEGAKGKNGEEGVKGKDGEEAMQMQVNDVDKTVEPGRARSTTPMTAKKPPPSPLSTGTPSREPTPSRDEPPSVKPAPATASPVEGVSAPTPAAKSPGEPEGEAGMKRLPPPRKWTKNQATAKDPPPPAPATDAMAWIPTTPRTPMFLTWRRPPPPRHSNRNPAKDAKEPGAKAKESTPPVANTGKCKRNDVQDEEETGPAPMLDNEDDQPAKKKKASLKKAASRKNAKEQELAPEEGEEDAEPEVGKKSQGKKPQARKTPAKTPAKAPVKTPAKKAGKGKKWGLSPLQVFTGASGFFGMRGKDLEASWLPGALGLFGILGPLSPTSSIFALSHPCMPRFPLQP
ncbi:unnamed protein product, partial [Peniophora sp. CBMAI 1063]